MDENRKKALAAALTQIEKQFGKGSVMRMGDANAVRNIEVVSTGSLGLDLALGVGGVPKGRVVEIYGPESSGKTTMTLHIVAEAQKTGGTCAFIDAEHALDPVYAEKLGVDMDELLVSQPDTGEQALEITDMLVRSGAVDVVVIDSVAALTPKAEIEGDMGDSHVGLQARLMSQALRKLTANIKRSNSIVIFINQIRMKIGVMFGSPETTTGGNALKFYASVRLDIRRTGAIKKGDEVVGNETRVKVVKNKVAPPFRQANFEILYGEGVSREGEIIELGVAQGLIEKSGAWYSYNGDRIGQGKENVRSFLKENPDIARHVESQIRAALIPETDEPEGLAEAIDSDAMTDAIDRDEATAIERGALRLLASREHTRLELRRKLARHHDEGQICPVLDELERRRLLSDARFAENYVSQRSRRGYGPLRLRAELTDKGVDHALTARYIEDGAVDWSVLLLEVAMRKFGDEPATDRQALARRGRFLQQRGFPVSLVARYLDRVRAF